MKEFNTIEETDAIFVTFKSLLASLPPQEQARLISKITSYYEENKPGLTLIPASVFSSSLSSYESLVLYLHDILHMPHKEISFILQRSHSSVIQTFNKAKSKGVALKITDSVFKVPLSIFNSDFGIQESVVAYLRETYNLSFNEIAKIINRNYNTAKTAYYKYKQKVSVQ